MNTPAPASTLGASLIGAEPQIFVSSMDAARGFYTQQLGFEIAFLYGQPPFYAQIVRGGARLNLRQVRGPVFDPQFRTREPDALSATIVLDDAEPLFVEYQAAGIQFHQSLKTEPWGARSFIVVDPDGNLIAFAGRG